MATPQQLPDSAQLHVDGLGLNDRIRIYADERDKDKGGNASHHYEVRMNTAPDPILGIFSSRVAAIDFQHGPRDEAGSVPGITDAVLIAVLLDRYRGFQAGPYRCRENALVITKLEEALHWMQARAMARHRQGVLGRNAAHEDPK